MPQTELLLRLRLRLDPEVRIQVQGLASGDVHFLIKLRVTRCAYFYVVTARPQIHGFQFPDCARVSAIDVYFSVFNAGIELQCAGSQERNRNNRTDTDRVSSKGRILPIQMPARR
jgi:hypothetical protein